MHLTQASEPLYIIIHSHPPAVASKTVLQAEKDAAIAQLEAAGAVSRTYARSVIYIYTVILITVAFTTAVASLEQTRTSLEVELTQLRAENEAQTTGLTDTGMPNPIQRIR